MNQQWHSLQDHHIFYTTSQQCEHAKATVFIIHGMSEHRHRYIHFTNQLNQAGYNTVTIDLRGHGDSPMHKELYGDFGDHGMDYMIEDFHQVVSTIRSEQSLPLYVFGHSMGSLFARAYVKKYPEDIDALIISGSPWKPQGLTALKGLIRILSPWNEHKPSPLIARISNQAFLKTIRSPQSTYDWLSFNDDNVKNYDEDPLCGFPFTINGYRTLSELFETIYSPRSSQITKEIPVLFIFGAYDPCLALEKNGDKKAIAWLHSHGLVNIQTICYPHSRHELLQDHEKEVVTHDIIHFLDQQVN